MLSDRDEESRSPEAFCALWALRARRREDIKENLKTTEMEYLIY